LEEPEQNLEENIAVSLPPLPAAMGAARRPVTIEWLKAPDGAKLGYRLWQGSNDAPVVLYLHGIEGHSQWFENTASALNERGLTVYAPDRRGCGMNGQSRGHISNYRTLLADLESQLRQIRRQHSGKSVFLIANCWSAKLAAILAQVNYKSTDQSLLPPFAGLILTSPAIYTRIDFPLPTKLKIAFSWLRGNKGQMQIWPIPLTTTMLTDNPDYLDYLQKDPLRLTDVTTSFLVQTFLLSLKAKEVAKNITIPTLILQAGVDEIVNIQKLENWYEKIPAADKAMRVFPEVCHSLDFDSAWFKEYTHMLSEWILARVPLL
jgi:acylglycerol lipase